MDKFIKNQKYLSISIFGCLILISLVWYFLFYQDLVKEYKRSRQIKRSISSEVKKHKGMETQLVAMRSDWDLLNDEFTVIIERIPDKRLFESVNDYLYSLIIKHGLVIQNFSPSDNAIETKTIRMPDSEEEIVVEKIPVDITLKGSFINFGKLLDAMLTGRYRMTASNIEVTQKESASAQTIKLISYTYFQSLKNKSLLKLPTTIKKNVAVKDIPKSNTTASKKLDVSDLIDKTISVPDSMQDVPEMWLEPATEPIDESIQITGSVPKNKTNLTQANSQPMPAQKTKSVKLKKDEPAQTQKRNEDPYDTDMYNNFHGIVILDSKICKKVKNNLPINPGRRFTTTIGKVYCHSLLNNNSGKHNDIYHIWYMNGQLKAKVRIRVRAGKEIPAISHRVVEGSDKGTWKVEITDNDKKILDTVIFEVV